MAAPTFIPSGVTITAPFEPLTGDPVSLPKVPKEVLIEKLREAIDLMNDGGRHWIQRAYVRLVPGGGMGYCALGAIATTSKYGDSEESAVVINALVSELLITLGREPRITWQYTQADHSTMRQVIDPMPILMFNDHEGRTWTEVKSLFESTIERLERDD